jgi:hypothetical protein
MSISETRFRLPLTKDLVFVRRPVTTTPPEGTLCFVDNGTETGWKAGQACGQWANGEWTNGEGRRLRFEPTYWTTMEEPDDGAK